MFGLLLCLTSCFEKRGIAAAGRQTIVAEYPFAHASAIELNEANIGRAIACTRPSWGYDDDDENSESEVTAVALDLGSIVDAVAGAIEQAIAVSRPGWGGWDDDDDENSDKSEVPAIEFKAVTSAIQGAVQQAISVSRPSSDDSWRIGSNGHDEDEIVKIILAAIKDGVKQGLSKRETNAAPGTAKAIDMRPIIAAANEGFKAIPVSNYDFIDIIQDVFYFGAYY